MNGPAAPDGHGVHVVGPRGTYARVTDVSDSHYYADSSCPTCRLTLLSVGRFGPYIVGAAQPHPGRADPRRVSGAIILGRQRVEPGDTLAIAAGVRYGFRGDDDGFVFVNYRRDASHQMWVATSTPARGRCGQRHDPRHGPDLTYQDVLASLRAPLGDRTDAKTDERAGVIHHGA